MNINVDLYTGKLLEIARHRVSHFVRLMAILKIKKQPFFGKDIFQKSARDTVKFRRFPE